MTSLFDRRYRHSGRPVTVVLGSPELIILSAGPSSCIVWTHTETRTHTWTKHALNTQSQPDIK